jgi:transcriptional regulator with XRE-family HTH domain
MTQHEPEVGARVVHRYDADTLGAPFKVTLVDSVSVRIDAETGEELVRIPDLVGLINAVVRSRVCHERKLNHEELKFIRKSLGVKANRLADFLMMSAEHLSRCEAGTKTMSAANEKLLRSFAFVATGCRDANSLLDGFGDCEKTLVSTRASSVSDEDRESSEFTRFFFSMKIEAAFDPDEILDFEFRRRFPVGHGIEPNDGKWNDMHKVAA